MHAYCKIYKLFWFVFLLFSLSGCRKENPNPELLDPIYLDLKSIHKEYLQKITTGEAELKEALKSLKQASVHSKELFIAKRTVTKIKDQLKKDVQMAHYYKIRTERRRIEGRTSYKSAFRAKKRWPDPSEYASYVAHKRLREINLNWNSRVPKLFKQNPNYSPETSAKSADSEAAPSSEGH